jgi:hypothetical protein
LFPEFCESKKMSTPKFSPAGGKVAPAGGKVLNRPLKLLYRSLQLLQGAVKYLTSSFLLYMPVFAALAGGKYHFTARHRSHRSPSDIKPRKGCTTYSYRDCVCNLTSEVFFFKCTFSRQGWAATFQQSKKCELTNLDL